MFEIKYTLKTIGALQNQIYVIALVVLVVAIGAAMFAARLVPHQGGKNAKDHIVRRVLFGLIGVIALLGFVSFYFLYVQNLVEGPPAIAVFRNTVLTASLLLAVLYVAIGFVISKMFKHTKFGTIFGKRK
jgi:hypothetical protein